MNFKKTIFIFLIICLFGIIIPKNVLAIPTACYEWCESKCGTTDSDLCRQIGDESGSSFTSGSMCSCCKKDIDSEGKTFYRCTCQGSNTVEDCKVGFLISDPVCACCGDCTLENFLELGTNYANKALSILGVFALLFFVIGGIIWISSGGSAERVKKGKDMIKGAVVGIIIVLFAFTVIRVVLKAFKTDEDLLPQSSEASETTEDINLANRDLYLY